MALAAMTESRPLNDEACWQAVVARRAASDGLFVVAVKTTGVYCRPSCPSRRPRRENVRFFSAPADAERGGFRACLRCRPRDPARADALLVQGICRRLVSGARAPTLAELGAEFGVSPFHLQRTFKRVTGVTPRQYAASRRTERLKRGLRAGEGVASAVYGAGFGSSSRVYESAGPRLGMTPGSYRRGGAGMRITYTFATCTFGRMLVGATERGVSAVSFGEGEELLERALREEYPAAELVRDDAGMRDRVEGVLRAVERGDGHAHLPLDIRATAFRARVWEALRAIPRGETRTYAEVARAVGQPRAARAVGNACASNPVAVLIPCHRVVRGDGSLGGYRFGAGRKRTLLERERSESGGAVSAARDGRSPQAASGRRAGSCP